MPLDVKLRLISFMQLMNVFISKNFIFIEHILLLCCIIAYYITPMY